MESVEIRDRWRSGSVGDATGIPGVVGRAKQGDFASFEEVYRRHVAGSMDCVCG